MAFVFQRDIEKTVCESRQIARSAGFRDNQRKEKQATPKVRKTSDTEGKKNKRHRKKKEVLWTMSQEKVDKYKAEKANRKKEVAKKKRQKKIYTFLGVILGLAFVTWIGYSVYLEIKANKEAESQQAALEEYLNQLATAATTSSDESATGDATTSADELATGDATTSSDESATGDATTSADESTSDEETTSQEETTSSATEE